MWINLTHTNTGLQISDVGPAGQNSSFITITCWTFGIYNRAALAWMFFRPFPAIPTTEVQLGQPFPEQPQWRHTGSYTLPQCPGDELEFLPVSPGWIPHCWYSCTTLECLCCWRRALVDKDTMGSHGKMQHCSCMPDECLTWLLLGSPLLSWLGLKRRAGCSHPGCRVLCWSWKWRTFPPWAEESWVRYSQS